MDIIVKGRRTDVNDRFRRHVDTKLAKIEKLDQKVIRVDVEVSQERNPRQADRRERVELTILSRGPVIRAEAAADDRYAALDLALDKLDSRLRRMSDRRKVHHGNHTPAKLATMEPATDITWEPAATATATRVAEANRVDQETQATEADRAGDAYLPAPEIDDHILPIAMEGDCPLVLREKFHKAEPMNIEQALFEMELVGHDFFLFRDTGNGQPSVVYRRVGWDYGVIRLVEE